MESSKGSRQKTAFWASATILVAWMLIVITGMRLPYLHTHIGFMVRAFIVFPTILAISVYFSFFFKSTSGLTGYERWMMGTTSRFDKIKMGLISFMGQSLLAGFIAWTSLSLTAWITSLVATKPIASQYQISSIKARGGPVWSTRFELTLVDEQSGRSVSLVLTRGRYEQSQWKNGEALCALGRTFALGTIIDSTTRDFELCTVRGQIRS